MKWSNEAWKKLCSAIKGLYTQKKLICFIALFCVIVLKTYTTSWFPTFFFFFKLKGCCSFRCIEIFSFFYLSICDGWVFSSWWWFQCNVFFLKKRLVDLSQPLNDYLSLKMFVSLWYFSTYLFVSIWFEKLHIAHCYPAFFHLLPFRSVMSLSLAFW